MADVGKQVSGDRARPRPWILSPTAVQLLPGEFYEGNPTLQIELQDGTSSVRLTAQQSIELVHNILRFWGHL